MPSRPAASSPSAGARLAKQARAGTKPEIALRRLLHARGLRYRVDAPLPLPGARRRADLLFTGAKVAVFVDGCFWHRCPVHATAPRSNAQWWADKLEANVRRDADTDRRLSEVGWTVVRVWEHEEPSLAAEAVAAVVTSAKQCGQASPQR